ncbi:MAG: AAA family ATPase [Marinifilaceae bacterium]
MNAIVETHKILLNDKLSAISRQLLTGMDFTNRFIAIKGNRGVGKTAFLLDIIRKHYHKDLSVLYVNMNNLFFTKTGLLSFVDDFYKTGGKVLLLDQIHKYPSWDVELKKIYNTYPELKIIFTTSSIVNIQSNKNINNIVKVYNLNGLSFREFLCLQTGKKFKTYKLDDIIKYHDRIVDDILHQIRPLAYFKDYMKYGYFPVFMQERSHIDNLLKNINLTLEFDIPYLNQIDLKYLPKLKQLLYLIASQGSSQPNISKLSSEIGVSRATIMNYLYYLREAKLLNLLVENGEEVEIGKKPNMIYVHNTNLLFAVNNKSIDDLILAKTFFLNQLSSVSKVSYSSKSDFIVDGKYRFFVDVKDSKSKKRGDSYIATDMIEKGKANIIPLWLFGFLY